MIKINTLDFSVSNIVNIQLVILLIKKAVFVD